MKKYLLLVCLSITFFFSRSFSQAGQWTWMKGDTSASPVAVYGTQGVPAAANTPPGMYEAVEWTDQSGNFWLFSGLGNNEQSDLWKYDPLANEWTWVKGPGVGLQKGIYGTKGVPSLANNPGARAWGSPTWVDASGNLWLYGGIGYDVNGGHVIFNDLWLYNIASNEWTWITGNDTGVYAAVYGTQGVFTATNDPGNRAESDASWTDKNGNLWMYGGAIYKGSTGNWSIQGCGADLWEFDIKLSQWAWIKGPQGVNAAAVYGTLGVPNINNNPGARDAYNKWIDANGDFWLFGGTNINTGNKFNDLWRYDIVSNMWTWMAGSNLPNDAGVVGSECLASSTVRPSARHESRSSYIDACGNLWLMGGQSSSPNYYIFNDMWKYDPVGGTWTWVSGHAGAGNPSYNFGTKGVSSLSNIPPGRMGNPGWTDKNGNLWLWGGDRSGFGITQNDLWRYVPDTTCGSCASSILPPVASFAASDTSICANDCISYTDLSTNATSWQWSFPGGEPPTSTDKNPALVCYPSAGIYNATEVVSNAGGSDSLTFANYINVDVSPPAPLITQSEDTLYASFDSSYVAYQWYADTSIINGATMSFLVISTNGNYNIRVTSKNGCSTATGINILGVKQFALNGYAFTLMPNPAGNIITVTGQAITGATRLDIYNTLGEKVYNAELETESLNKGIIINISNLSKGVYFVELQSETNRWIRKLVKE